MAALTFLFEGEVLCEVPALVVPSQEEECGGVVDLERPEVENTLWQKKRERKRGKKRVNKYFPPFSRLLICISAFCSLLIVIISKQYGTEKPVSS